MKFAFRTLGCKMNWLDSARISAGLQEVGHEQTDDIEEAETIFINSCIVTGKAERESRKEVSHFLNLKKHVILFGCGPKENEKLWREKFPEALIFPSEKELLEHFHISDINLPFPDTSRTRLPVAIQTGCDNFCTFCVTREARGKHENLSLEGIIKQIQRAETHGIQEVVLTGINLAAWGCENSNNPEESKLGILLQEILKRTSLPRIRLSSLGPQYLQNDFFLAFKDSRICDHLHLSVQSGSQKVLQSMNRGHGTQEIYTISEAIRKIRPSTAFTADFIVGFPGETEEDFQETLHMVETIPFVKLHVFPFSPRQKTGAKNMNNQIPSSVKKERARILREKGQELRKKFIETQYGKNADVLIENDETGLTSNYIRIRVPKGKEGELKTFQISKENVVE